MADVHIAAFPGEFLSLLGRGVLKAYYRFYMVKPGGICLVAVDDKSGRVMGLVAGGRPELRSNFLLNHAIRVVGTALCKAVIYGRVRLRLLEYLGAAFRRILRKLDLLSAAPRHPAPPEDPPGTWSNLLSICTHPDLRGRGVGNALMAGFRAESQRRGYSTMRLSVHNDNEAAIALYTRCGWKAIITTPKGTYFKRSVGEDQ